MYGTMYTDGSFATKVFARKSKNYILLEIHSRPPPRLPHLPVTESFYYWLNFHSTILDGKSLVI